MNHAHHNSQRLLDTLGKLVYEQSNASTDSLTIGRDLRKREGIVTYAFTFAQVSSYGQTVWAAQAESATCSAYTNVGYK